AGNEIAGDDEEDVDADKTARHGARPQVEQDDKQDRDRTQTLNFRPEIDLRSFRCRGVPSAHARFHGKENVVWPARRAAAQAQYRFEIGLTGPLYCSRAGSPGKAGNSSGSI